MGFLGVEARLSVCVRSCEEQYGNMGHAIIIRKAKMNREEQVDDNDMDGCTASRSGEGTPWPRALWELSEQRQLKTYWRKTWTC